MHSNAPSFGCFAVSTRGDSWTVPVAGCILAALIAAAIPSKLDRPLVQLEVHPQRDLSMIGPFKSGSSRSAGSDCTETQDEGSGEEFAAKLNTFPAPNAPFQASFVPDGEPDILCDQCALEIEPGDFQICWVQINSVGSVNHWFHGQCFPTHCCQEGIEEEVINAMLDWSSEDNSLSVAVEGLANILLSMTTSFIDDSQPGEDPTLWWGCPDVLSLFLIRSWKQFWWWSLKQSYLKSTQTPPQQERAVKHRADLFEL